MAEYWPLQQKKKPYALVYTVKEPLGVFEIILENKPSRTAPDRKLSDVQSERKPQETDPDSIYLLFVSDGSVSLMVDSVAVPVKKLCDIETTQSLLLQGVLPLTKQSFAEASMLVQGVKLRVLKVPLYKVPLHKGISGLTLYLEL